MNNPGLISSMLTIKKEITIDKSSLFKISLSKKYSTKEMFESLKRFLVKYSDDLYMIFTDFIKKITIDLYDQGSKVSK